MAAKIQPLATAFSEPRKAKRPRVKDEDYLKLIRALPCLIDGTRPVEAAHIRSACLVYGKRATGMGEKASDRWTLPLSQERHREQHEGNELEFWRRYGIDPFVTAMALWGARDNFEDMEMIARLSRTVLRGES